MKALLKMTLESRDDSTINLAFRPNLVKCGSLPPKPVSSHNTNFISKPQGRLINLDRVFIPCINYKRYIALRVTNLY